MVGSVNTLILHLPVEYHMLLKEFTEMAVGRKIKTDCRIVPDI